MEDCLFCKIVRSEIPSEQVYQDGEFLAFRDIHPKAPVHVLVIPKRHIPSLADIQDSDEAILGKLFHRVSRIAEQIGVSEKGYKVLVNVREHGGQVIPHIHVHIVGGKKIEWKV